MSFSLHKSWDNRTKPVRIDPATNKSWTRRVQWLNGTDGLVKLKLEDVTDGVYREVLCPDYAAQIIWDRFKTGQSINDAVSILANPVPKGLQSKRAQEGNDHG